MQQIQTWQDPAANLIGNTTSAQIFQTLVNGAASGIAVQLPVPGTGRLDGLEFIARAAGYVTTGTTTNVTVTIYAGTSITPGSNTILLASTARAVNTASAPWRIEAKMQMSNFGLATVNPGICQGTVEVEINNLFDAPAPFTNVISTISTQTEPVFNIVVGVTFSASNAGNIASMGSLILEA